MVRVWGQGAYDDLRSGLRGLTRSVEGLGLRGLEDAEEDR